MLEALKAFENRPPEIVFHWQDRETEAEGWTVINSLRGGAAGGGTRMRKGLNRHEVVSLAKTMEIKFSVAGPPIGGAKSGINFDPDDPRKAGVLRRWYAAVLPLLKSYYGTGGDLNVDEIREVLPITHGLGLLHCQEGVVNGHFKAGDAQKRVAIRRLQDGVSKPVTDPRYAPDPGGRYVVADLITGWGVAEAALEYYRLWGLPYEGKRVIVQGFGNVGGAAAYYLAQAGMKIVAITDKESGILRPEGLSFAEVKQLLLTRAGTTLDAPDEIPFAEANEKMWDIGAEVFLPCARSRIVTDDQVESMLRKGLEVISPGANVPFHDPEIFLGRTGVWTDDRVAVLPDFIANCGMARAFAYFMGGGGEMSDEAIFSDTSATIRAALQAIRARNPASIGLWQAGLKIALQKLENSALKTTAG